LAISRERAQQKTEAWTDSFAAEKAARLLTGSMMKASAEPANLARDGEGAPLPAHILPRQ
jgi:hypothetical protein